MLVLTRKVGETIVVGDDDVRITILEVKGTQIRIGFSAEKSMPIHRLELYKKLKKENNVNLSLKKEHSKKVEKSTNEKTTNVRKTC